MTTQGVRQLVGLLCLAASLSLRAASDPVIIGMVDGVELCPQSICGSALFGGVFAGRTDDNSTRGAVLVQVTHGDLPNVGGTAPITGGSWIIRTKKAEFVGTITGGTLTANPDNTFHVALTLALSEGGSGTLTFEGILDHNEFPPTNWGIISQ